MLRVVLVVIEAGRGVTVTVCAPPVAVLGDGALLPPPWFPPMQLRPKRPQSREVELLAAAGGEIDTVAGVEVGALLPPPGLLPPIQLRPSRPQSREVELLAAAGEGLDAAVGVEAGALLPPLGLLPPMQFRPKRPQSREVELLAAAGLAADVAGVAPGGYAETTPPAPVEAEAGAAADCERVGPQFRPSRPQSCDVAELAGGSKVGSGGKTAVVVVVVVVVVVGALLMAEACLVLT